MKTILQVKFVLHIIVKIYNCMMDITEVTS